MVGIISYGAYIPIWRISRDEIARAHGSATMGGERSVASFDEDSLTMAVEAGLDCLTGIDPKEVDALFFATVTSPLEEKQASAMIASALDLRRDITTADITGTLRAGTTAVKMAMDMVKAGSAKKVLVTAADSRIAIPSSDLEQIFGDGAAALLIGEDGVIADIEGFSTVINPIPGPWRREVDPFPRRFEAKLDTRYGYLRDLPTAAGMLAKKLNLSPKDISKVAIYGPDPRSILGAANMLGIDPKTQLQDPLFSTVGITGTPHALLLLVAALEQAKPDERILCASQGDGSDAFVVKTTEKVEELKGTRRGTNYIKSKKMLPSYAKFAAFKGVLDTGWPSQLPEMPRSPIVKYWRDEKAILPFYGMKCKKCGNVSYPIGRVCMYCGEKDNYEEVKLARRGKVYTFTHDYLFGPGNIQPGDGINPSTKVSVDLEDGCRVLLELTDHDLKEVDVGMEVELTFRLWHERARFRHYGWKARPVRG
ncbi:MAG: 3-hydroxy-3-methylglutaryl CoA synthase [Candidatus Alkanophagales archaeon MCA70_species_1]|nr:3-hydroxy-3-methylglutaryl CoA synthase [Candidatus Alkanophaga volatiphilum]